MAKYVIIVGGKVAEWLKALVLKTRDGNVRRFESCPFRQDKKKPRGGLFFIVMKINSGQGLHRAKWGSYPLSLFFDKTSKIIYNIH